MEDFFDLRAFLIKILRHWRHFLLWSAVFALGLWAYKVLPLLAQPGKGTAGDTQDSYTRELSLYESYRDALLTRETALFKSLDGTQAYLENSLLMKIDPSHVFTTTVVYQADTGYQLLLQLEPQPADKTPQVVEAYWLSLVDNRLYTHINASMGAELDRRDLEELLSLKISDYALRIDVMAPSAELSVSLAEAIAGYFSLIGPEIGEKVAVHTFTQLSFGTTTLADFTLAARQTDAYLQLAQLKVQLEEVQGELQGLTPPAGGPAGWGYLLKRTFLWSGLGVVAGLFVVIIWVFLKDIMNVRVSSVHDVYRKYHLRYLGTLQLRKEEEYGASDWD